MSRLIARKINPLVGLAAEAYQHNKNKKAQSALVDTPPQQQTGQRAVLVDRVSTEQDVPPTYQDAVYANDEKHLQPTDSKGDESDTTDETDNDEDDWARDMTQDELETQQSPEQVTNTSRFIQDFFARHPDHLRGGAFQPLPYPVVIPQRRPNHKSRGFIRAYAPTLYNSGIDESTFLDFITGFEKATHGQGAFNAFNAAVLLSVIAETAADGPSIIVHFSAMAVHLSVEAGRRVYETVRTNTYLDKMNEHLFKPHGLYAMVMSYKPGSSHVSHIADLNANTVSAVAAHEGGRSKIHAAAGHATNDQIPACAPLVFPTLDRATDEQKQNAFKRGMAFIGDYSDRRAQATWQQRHPGSSLNVPGGQPQFASSFGDPTHAAYSSGVLNLLTGGRAGGLRQDRRIYRNERKEQRREFRAARHGRAYQPSLRQQWTGFRKDQMGVAANDPRGMRDVRWEYRRKTKEQGLTPVSFVKRQLGEDVLYLMIVNTPTERNLEEARARTKRSGIFG